MKIQYKLFQMIFLISLGSLFLSCNKKKENFVGTVIPLKDAVGTYDVLHLSDYVTNIRYVPLETSDTVLISKIRNIAYENEKIVILLDLPQHECFVFDRDGRFECEISSKGQGPEEYNYAHQIFLNDRLIYLRTTPPLLMVYTMDGTFVKKISRPEMFDANYVVRDIQLLKEDVFVMDVVSYGNIYPKALVFEEDDSLTYIVKEFSNPIKIEKKTSGFSSNETAILYRFGDEVRSYKYINSDTIFTIGKDMKMKEAFIFDLGKHKPTREYFESATSSFSSLDFIRPRNIVESSDYLFFNFFFMKNAPEPFDYVKVLFDGQRRIFSNMDVYAVFNKNTGILNLMKQPIKRKQGFKNDLDNGPVIWPHYITENNELITYISADDFLEHYHQMENPSSEIMKLANKMKPDDNPVVIIATLKSGKKNEL